MSLAAVAMPAASVLALGSVGWAAARWWRSAAWGLMLGPVVWLWLVVVSCELLGAVGALRPAPLVAVQLALVVAAVVVGRRRPPLWVRGHRPRLGGWVWVWVVLTALLLVTVLTTAPNNLDSLAYHLVKADQWLSQGSLQHVRTPYPAQVYLGPAAELGVLQLLADSRGWIALAGLLQLAAHVGTAAGAWLVAGNLGGGRNARGLAALLATTAPVAVAEATTTQNDYVVALALTACLAAVTDRDPGRLGARLVVVGLGSGVAVSTKATAVLFPWPVLVWGVWVLRREASRRHLALVLVAALLCCLPAVGWAVRNADTFGSPLGPPSALTVQSPDARGTAVNALRNLGHAVGTPVGAVNAGVESVVGAAAGALGDDVDDPSWVYGAQRWNVDGQLNEDRAPWVLQSVLLLLALVAMALAPRSPTTRAVLPLVATIAAGFLTFSAVVRWQPWGGRLLLPLVVWSGVVSALWLARVPRGWQVVAVVGVVLQALPWVLLSTWRPLASPSASTLRTSTSAELFAARPELERPLTDAVHHLLASQPTSVALGAGTYPVEYQVRWLLRTGTERDVLVQHVDPDPTTAGLPPQASPEVGLCLCDTAPAGASTQRFGPVLTWSTAAAAG